MPNNAALTDKVRAALAHIPDVVEKKMFGGVTFMVNGKMCVSAGKDRLMCRIDPAIHEKALKRKGCATVVMNGREYRGFIHVNEEGMRTKRDFDFWIALALDHNKNARAPARSKKK